MIYQRVMDVDIVGMDGWFFFFYLIPTDAGQPTNYVLDLSFIAEI